MIWKKNYNYYLISSGILAGLLLVLIALIIYPGLKTILDIRAEISQEKTSLENKLAMGLNAKQIKIELDAISGQLAPLDNIYIESGKELDLLNLLDALAAKNQVQAVAKPDFSAPAYAPGINRLPLHLEITGSFKNLLQFMNDLDSQELYYVIDNLTLEPGEKDNFLLTLDGQFYLKGITK